METIRKALAMGADEALHVVDPALHGSDALVTSYVLAKALTTVDYDLVILGAESTDARMSVIPAMLAERTGAAQLTFARKVQASGSTVRIERPTDTGYEVVEASSPAIVSVVEKINEPRYPSFKGIMAAKRKPITCLSLADAGIEAANVGLGGSGTEVAEFAARLPKRAGQIVPNEGDSGYAGKLVTWSRAALKLTFEIVKRPDDLHTFKILPRRWVVERTLAWITRQRRTVRDYELPRRRGNSYYPEALVIPS